MPLARHVLFLTQQSKPPRPSQYEEQTTYFGMSALREVLLRCSVLNNHQIGVRYFQIHVQVE